MPKIGSDRKERDHGQYPSHDDKKLKIYLYNSRKRSALLRSRTVRYDSVFISSAAQIA
jgi:hypothetical protein